MGHILPRILVHGHLFQNNAPLHLHVLRGHPGVEQHIRQQLHGRPGVFRQRLGIKAGVFLGGVGVHAAAQQIHLLGYLPGGAGVGTLEGHMLHKMGDALFVRRLVPGARLHPYAHGGGERPLYRQQQHPQAIVQCELFQLFHRIPPPSTFFLHRLVYRLPPRLSLRRFIAFRKAPA